MAVMQTCCCCGIRPGSNASAMYSIIISIMGAAYFGFRASKTNAEEERVDSNGFSDLDDLVKVFLVLYYAAVILFIFVVVASVFVFIGISQDSKGFLVPFLVAKGLHLLWYLAFFIVDMYWLISIKNATALGYFYLLSIILSIPFFIADLMCFLCVLSQYQEYSDGRGQAATGAVQYQPAPSSATTTYVIQQQAVPTQAYMPTVATAPPTAPPGAVYYSPPPPPYK